MRIKLTIFSIIMLFVGEQCYASDMDVKQDFIAGCAKGAEVFSKMAPDMEKRFKTGLDSTLKGTPARQKHLDDWEEFLESARDAIATRERNFIDEFRNSSVYKNMIAPERGLREIRINMYYSGLKTSITSVSMVIMSRVSKSQFGATEERYRRLIEEDCTNMEVSKK